MQNRKDGKCHNEECEHFPREHRHVMTNNGAYVKFIVEKPIDKPIREIHD